MPSCFSFVFHRHFKYTYTHLSIHAGKDELGDSRGKKNAFFMKNFFFSKEFIFFFLLFLSDNTTWSMLARWTEQSTWTAYSEHDVLIINVDVSWWKVLVFSSACGFVFAIETIFIFWYTFPFFCCQKKRITKDWSTALPVSFYFFVLYWYW